MSYKFTIGIVLAVVIAGGATWALTSSRGDDARVSTLPPEYAPEKLKEAAQQDPSTVRATMRKAFEDDALTDEQKRELRRNIGNTFRAMMDERVDEYFAAPPEEQTAVLDRQIDEWVQRMEEWRREREQREAEGQDEDEEARRERWRKMRDQDRNATTEQRKARSENRDPDQMARRMAYFQAARARMEARGIEMPRGPWGRGGGGGTRGGGGRRGGG